MHELNNAAKYWQRKAETMKVERIRQHQRQYFTEVVQAASDMVEVMEEKGDTVYDREWIDAVKESVIMADWLLRNHTIYISKEEG